MPPTPRSAPIGVVVIGAGVMGRFHAETVAGLKQAELVADAIQRSLASGKPVALS